LGAQFERALKTIVRRVNLEIVKRSDRAKRFIALPKRWIVERTFAWLGRGPQAGQGLGMPPSQGARLPQTRSIRLMLLPSFARTLNLLVVFNGNWIVF
jgi:transposase